MREQLIQLQACYSDYIRQCRRISIDAPYGAGIFSPGKDPRNHPCHEQFYREVEQLVVLWTRLPGNPEPIIRYMLETPYFYAHEEACWYLLAAQNHAKVLIPMLDAPSRAALGDWFSQLVPRTQRLPAQEEILEMLMK